jgi:hypothetical protein
MAEQIVGRGQLDAPNASPVRFCLRLMVAVMEFDDAGRRRDVVAASVAPTATTALAGVVMEMGGEGLEKGLAGGIDQLILCRWRESLGWPREDAGGRVLSGPMQTLPKFESRMGRAGHIGTNV